MIQVQSVEKLVVAKVENNKKEQKKEQTNAALYGVEAGRMQTSDWIAL
jgi:hypothetical protein